jgi:hypothetical protein
MGMVLGSLSAGGLTGSGLKVAADFVDRRALAAAGAFGYTVCLLDEPFLGFTVAFLEQVRDETPAVATATISVAVVGGIVGFPWLVGATADALGLAAGLALYAAVPVAILVLLALGGGRSPDDAS